MKHNLVSVARKGAGLLFIAGCVIANSQAQTAIPQMVSHFPLDETGTEIVDVISGAKGTLTAGNEWISGKVGGALKVTAGNQIPHNPAFDFADESFSVAYWLRIDAATSTSHPHPLAKGDYEASELGKGIRWQFDIEGTMRFTVDDGATKVELQVPGDPYMTGEWVHVAGVRDRDQKKLLLYANGEVQGEKADNAGSVANPVDLVIGNSSRGEAASALKGDIDDIRMFRLVLSKEQIAAVMAAKESVSNSPTVREIEKLAFYTPALGQKISLENKGFHSMEIIDIHGKILRVLPVSPDIFWNGADKTGTPVESGVYVARLLGSGESFHQRFVLAR